MNDIKFHLPVEEQLTILKRGVADLVSEDDLRRKLMHSIETRQPLRVKLGADPTRPDLHLGHAVILRKMRQFQDLGHTVIMLIGDFTAIIGDPTGKSKTRPPVTLEQTRANAQSYLEQCKLILRSEPEVLELRYNSEWLEPMGYADVIRLASRYTVARIMERDDFKKRFEGGVPISMHELLYPLTQGYDSVALHADVELGGTDQLFNNLVGRALQRDYDQEPQVVMTLPLLVGLDGVEKMSKSLDNYIGLTEEPDQMFAKLMKVPDGQMENYLTLLTDLSYEDIKIVLRSHHSTAHRALAALVSGWLSSKGEMAMDKSSLELLDVINYQKIFDSPVNYPEMFLELRNKAKAHNEVFRALKGLIDIVISLGLEDNIDLNLSNLRNTSGTFINGTSELIHEMNRVVHGGTTIIIEGRKIEDFVGILKNDRVDDAEKISISLMNIIENHLAENSNRLSMVKKSEDIVKYSERFTQVAKGGIPEKIDNTVSVPTSELSLDGTVTLARLMVMAGLEDSLSAARRTIQGKGLKVDGQPFLDPQGAVSVPDGGVVIQKGKDKFARMVLEG